MTTSGCQFKIDGLTHYQRNKDYYKAVNKKNKMIAKQFIYRVKRFLRCADCGLRDHRVLDFDHLSDKIMPIAIMQSRGWGVESIKKEMRKCQAVCANCHRIRTYNRRHGLMDGLHSSKVAHVGSTPTGDSKFV